LRCIMGKVLTVLVIAAIACLPLSPAGAGEKAVIYDRDYILKYRIDDSGRIYDGGYKLKGRIEGDKVYDENYNIRYRLRDNKIYDRNWDLKYRRGGDRIYDGDYRPKGTIKER